MSHTPGPWTYSPYHQKPEEISNLRALGLEPTQSLSNDGQRYIMATDKRVALVDCQTPFKRGMGYKAECPERDANAALIAAAPELLDALRLLLDDQGKHSIGCKEFAPGYDDSRCCPVHIARAAIAKATGG